MLQLFARAVVVGSSFLAESTPILERSSFGRCLFSESQTDTIFGLSNERFLFEEVHQCLQVLPASFEKGGENKKFSRRVPHQSP